MGARVMVTKPFWLDEVSTWLVAGTRSIGVIPGQLARLVVTDAGLRTIRLPADFSPIAVRQLWHARHDQDPAHRWLRALVAEACADLQAGRIA